MTSFKEKQDISVLIIAYRRFNNVQKISQLCLEAGITNFFFHIDVPKSDQISALADNQQVLETINKFDKSNSVNCRKLIATANKGCAVSVISALDWAFLNCQRLIILEDDCIPTKAFFDFCLQGLDFIKSKPNIFLVCGTQLAPLETTKGKSVVSKYVLTWGWATTKEKWKVMREEVINEGNALNLNHLLAVSPESNFWSAGARRAFHGYIDTWDSLISNFLIRNKSYSLLPQENLILNLGNDVVAEHVEAKSIWTQVPVSEKNFIPLLPEFNSECDDWLKRNFYQIRLRHFFSTKFNLILDLMIATRRIYPKDIKARLLFK